MTVSAKISAPGDHVTPEWFDGALMAGFECTTYRRKDGVRLDLLSSTGHDRRAAEDYMLVAQHGMRCVRDGLVWHRIERAPGCYDWSLFDHMVDAAATADVHVMWDLVHFGWPDWTHPLAPGFADRVAALAERAAERVGPGAAFVPINEISFLAWACGDEGFMHPHFSGHGHAVKHALCAAFIQAAQAIRAVNPLIPIACAEPLVAVHAIVPDDLNAASATHDAQYQAVDMIIGTAAPELGGSRALIDVIGLNHYPHSQWVYGVGGLPHEPRDLSAMLIEAQQRYHLPLFVAETGCEGDERPQWFQYVMQQVADANHRGGNVRSTCLYPILNHLGWQDDRYCPNGLFCGVSVDRVVHEPLAAAIADWRAGRALPTVRHIFHAPPPPLADAVDKSRDSFTAMAA